MVNSSKRYTRSSVAPVPKQSRPNMVLKAFRIPPELWRRVEETCSRLAVNPSDAVRDALKRWVEDHEQDG